jgi:carbon monoxide dehydrogenase subunit G
MDMTGTQHIEAPRDVVWAALNDVEVLRQSIPGCQSIEKISDTEMNAKVTLKVGPVKATFTGKVTLSNLDPPNGYTITGEGSGGAAGFAKGSATVRLVESTGSTDLNYEVKAQIGGKLAQLGARLIDATSKKLASEFFEKFGEAVAGPVETPADDASTPAAIASTPAPAAATSAPAAATPATAAVTPTPATVTPAAAAVAPVAATATPTAATPQKKKGWFRALIGR